MTTATALLRPFPTPPGIARLMANTTLRVGAFELRPDDRLVLGRDEFLRSSLEVQLGDSVNRSANYVQELCAEIRDLGIRPESAMLAINLYSGFLKYSDYVVLVPMSELGGIPNPIVISGTDERPRALRTAHSGCRVEISVLLAEQLPPAPGRPWRKGTWLARSRFYIGTEREFSGFSPRPLGKEEKSALGLSPRAMRYVSLPATLNPCIDDFSFDSLELWLDSDLLAAISAQPKSSVAVAVQGQLFVDAMRAIVLAARADPRLVEMSWEDVEASTVGRVIRGLSGAGRNISEHEVAQRCNHLLTLVKTDVGKFMSIVEARTGLTAAYLKALEG